MFFLYYYFRAKRLKNHKVSPVLLTDVCVLVHKGTSLS